MFSLSLTLSGFVVEGSRQKRLYSFLLKFTLDLGLKMCNWHLPMKSGRGEM
jgi:hypothetical protein